ncbi:hypothetical protein [Photobacterium leiognathi]|uniref:hypothetical protein n=1 Tax=Photobacterium leiognathi TaxID=553611 RepID=UPI0027349041|nr:hypothetical protein [Photobacterium leiognathi]
MPVNTSASKILSSFLFVIIMTISIVFFTGNYTYTTSVTGFVVDPSITKITSNINGQVVSLNNSSIINKNEAIATIVNDNSEVAERLYLSNNDTLFEVSKLIDLTNKQIDTERENYSQTIKHIERNIKIIEKDILINKKNLEALNKIKHITEGLSNSTDTLYEKGHASYNDKTKIDIELNKIDTDINKIKSAIENLKFKKNEIEEISRKTKSEKLAIESQLLDRILQYKRNLKDLSERYSKTITSPIRLENTKILAKIGERISVGDIIAAGEMQTNERKYIQYKASQQTIGFARVGHNLVIRVDAYPYDKFGVIEGKIIRISEFSNLDRNQRMADNSDNFYYMDVEINPSDKIPLSYLKDGMKTDATIRLQQMNLIEWLFLPITNSLIRNPEF